MVWHSYYLCFLILYHFHKIHGIFGVNTHAVHMAKIEVNKKNFDGTKKKIQSTYLKLMQKCNFSMSGFGSHVFRVVSGETVLCLLAFFFVQINRPV